MKDVKFTRLVIFVNALVPMSLLLWDVYQKKVGANPLEFVTRTTGMLTLVFLFLTLAITPVRKITRANWLIKIRRMVGLFAFFYGATHLLTYIWFDQFFNARRILSDVGQRPFIAIGMAAFFLMVPLTITSTDKMVKRLGAKRWIRLHRLVYLSAILGVLHFWMLVKSDTRLPLTFGFVLLLLLGHRLFVKYFPPQDQVGRTTLFSRD
jgi:sulfoxide reductase heme-binding subunit YedZ